VLGRFLWSNPDSRVIRGFLIAILMRILIVLSKYLILKNMQCGAVDSREKIHLHWTHNKNIYHLEYIISVLV